MEAGSFLRMSVHSYQYTQHLYTDRLNSPLVLLSVRHISHTAVLLLLCYVQGKTH
jgi:hypothetical protein